MLVEHMTGLQLVGTLCVFMQQNMRRGPELLCTDRIQALCACLVGLNVIGT